MVRGRHNARMSQREERNPFQRGTGSYPPVLAGRQAELAALGGLLDGLAEGALEQPIHLLQAPRGLGKTVLLQALVRDAPSRPKPVDILRLSAGSYGGAADLAMRIGQARAPWRRLANWFGGISLFGLRIQRPPGAAGPAVASSDLERSLQRSRRPVLVAIDEAHMLPPDSCRILLNAFQNTTGPVTAALLLVGTPGLMPRLLSAEVGASFAERVPIIVPGLLSAEHSLDALRVPQWQHWQVDESILAEVAAEALGYPYFLQLWGEQLWEAGLQRRTVDRQTLKVARPAADAVRADFYASRFDEFERLAQQYGMDRDPLLAAVQRVAPAVARSGASVTTRWLNDACQASGLTAEQTISARQCFIDNGFLLRAGDEWQAAIPSFATYIRNHPR